MRTQSMPPGRRFRGNGVPIPVRAHPLVKRLIAEANAQRVSLQYLCDKSGVCRRTVRFWRIRGSSPQVHLLEAAFNVLGKTLVPEDME